MNGSHSTTATTAMDRHCHPPPIDNLPQGDARSSDPRAAGAVPTASVLPLSDREFDEAVSLVSDLARALVIDLRDDEDAVRVGEELSLQQVHTRARAAGHFGRLLLLATINCGRCEAPILHGPSRGLGLCPTCRANANALRAMGGGR